MYIIITKTIIISVPSYELRCRISERLLTRYEIKKAEQVLNA